MSTNTVEKTYIPEVGDEVEMFDFNGRYRYAGRIIYADDETFFLRNDKIKNHPLGGKYALVDKTEIERMRLYTPQKPKFVVRKARELNPEQTVICRVDGGNMRGKKYFVVNAEKPHAKYLYQKYKEATGELIEELDEFFDSQKEQK